MGWGQWWEGASAGVGAEMSRVKGKVVWCSEWAWPEGEQRLQEARRTSFCGFASLCFKGRESGSMFISW